VRGWAAFVGLAVGGVLGSQAGATASVGAPGPPPDDGTAGYVVVVGVAGLRWDDVDPHVMPQLAQLASEGSVGTLSVRSAPSVTCPSEGWATLGAGTYAAVVDPGTIDPNAGCSARPVPSVERLPEIDRLNRDLRFGARVGWLARQVDCVTAVGDGAALAAATADGHVARNEPALPTSTSEVRALLDACPATLVDLGVLPTATENARTTALTRLDTELRRVEDALPPETILMVLGLAEEDARQPRLHTAVVSGPGFRGGYLRSASTRRLPYVQLVDVAPSIVQALGGEVPDTVAGRPFVGDGGRGHRPDTLAATVRILEDADRRAVEQRRVLPAVWGALGAAFGLVALALAAAAARRRPQAVGVLRLAALGLMAVPAATFLANLVPWWRSSRPAVALLGAVFGAALALLVLTVAVGRRRWLVQRIGAARSPLAVVAAASLGVFFADGLSGAGLQIDSLLGYNALHAGRFVGFGNIAFAVLGAAAVLVAALLADGRRRGPALAIVGAVAVPVLALDGSPRWGADFGGVLTLVPTFAVLALLVAGARVTWRRLIAAQAAAALVVGTVGWLDYLRPAADRSHFGRFVGTVLDGTAYETIERKALASWELLFIGPHTLAALLLAVGLVAAVFRPPALLRQAYATHSVLRPLLQATVALALFGFATNDSGVAIPAVVALVTVPAALVLCASTADGEPAGIRLTSEST
jgi:hypothetical protein